MNTKTDRRIANGRMLLLALLTWLILLGAQAAHAQANLAGKTFTLNRALTPSVPLAILTQDPFGNFSGLIWEGLAWEPVVGVIGSGAGPSYSIGFTETITTSPWQEWINYDGYLSDNGDNMSVQGNYVHYFDVPGRGVISDGPYIFTAFWP